MIAEAIFLKLKTSSLGDGCASFCGRCSRPESITAMDITITRTVKSTFHELKKPALRRLLASVSGRNLGRLVFADCCVTAVPVM